MVPSSMADTTQSGILQHNDSPHNFIVSKGGEETSCVLRRLLSKSEYPFRVAHQHFIVERKEGKTG